MNRHKRKLSDRILLVLMAVLLVVNLLPIALYASETEEPPIVEEGNDTEETPPEPVVETNTVTVKSTGSGRIKLNGVEQESLTVDQNAEITVEIVPDIGRAHV